MKRVDLRQTPVQHQQGRKLRGVSRGDCLSVSITAETKASMQTLSSSRALPTICARPRARLLSPSSIT